MEHSSIVTQGKENNSAKYNILYRVIKKRTQEFYILHVGSAAFPNVARK